MRQATHHDRYNQLACHAARETDRYSEVSKQYGDKPEPILHETILGLFGAQELELVVDLGKRCVSCITVNEDRESYQASIWYGKTQSAHEEDRATGLSKMIAVGTIITINRQLARHANKHALNPESIAQLPLSDFGPLIDDGSCAELQHLADYPILRDTLSQLGLAPKYSQQIANGKHLRFSNTFDLPDRIDTGNPYSTRNRSAIIVYPDTGMPYIFYKSQSQANWRLLPAISEEGWYCKGQDETALQAPSQLQQSYSRIESTGNVPLSEDPDTHVKIIHLITMLAPQIPHIDPGSYPDSSIHFSSVRLNPEVVDHKDVPTGPNFTTPIASWRSSNKLYGDHWFDAFLSNDMSLRYVFAHNLDGLAWLSQVEPTTPTPIRQTGLYNTYIDLNDTLLSVPACEYHHTNRFSLKTVAFSRNPHYADYFTLGTANSQILQSYRETIPDERYPWKSKFSGVPSWQKCHIEHTVQQMENPESPAFYCADAIEAAMQAVSRHKSLNPRVMVDYQSIAQLLLNTAGLIVPDGNIKTSDDTPLDTGSVFDSRMNYDSSDFIAIDSMLEKLGFSEVSRVPERYDPKTHYIYLKSIRFPGIRLVVTANQNGLLAINPA